MTAPKTTAQRLSAIERKVDLLLSATGTHENEQGKVKSRMLKLDWKFAAGGLSVATGIGFTYKILAPAVIAFLIDVHHRLIGFPS